MSPPLDRPDGRRRRYRRLLVLAYGLLALAPDLRAQDAPGKVLSSSKISATAGGFDGVLDLGVRFGVEVSPIGDLDGNGITDLAVGSHRDNDGGPERGALWILFMRADGTVQGHTKISSTSGGFGGLLQDGDRFGKSVTCLGDLDLDGVPDLAVGAYRDSAIGVDRGAVWILFLRPDGTVKKEQRIGDGEESYRVPLRDSDSFGWAVEALGDHNGDGIPDLAIGSNRDDAGALDAGAVYITFLNRDGTIQGGQKISATQGGFGDTLHSMSRFGSSLADLGDLNGDGVDDLAVGAFEDDDGGTWTGAVWIVFLDGSGACVGWQKISASQGGFGGTLEPGDRFGVGVATPGDLDGDGTNDLVVGSFGDDDGGPDAGALFVLTLNGNGTVKSFQKVGPGSGLLTETIDPGDQLGTSVKAMGDVDGDGVGDLVVGAYRDDDGGTDFGAVYLLHLSDGTNPAPVADFQMTPSGGTAPQTVDFQDLSTGHVGLWSWDFGDGATSELRNPSHTFTTPGSYAVTLRAEGVGGVDTRVRTIQIDSATQTYAAFDAAPVEGYAPLSVTFTDLSGGELDSWQWSFGDGTSSSQRNPTHAYSTPGLYSVSLRVDGPGGPAELLRSNLIRVLSSVPNPPTAAFTATPTEGHAPLDVAFTDLSAGEIDTWLWSFGDGTSSSLASPAHTYSLPGTYGVTLTLTGPGGSDQATGSIQVFDEASPPVAAFSVDNEWGSSPLRVKFTDLSSGTISTHAWDFGDGSTSTSPSPSHQYKTSGAYDATLTVVGPAGSDTATFRIWIDPEPPVAALGASPRTGPEPLTVDFSDLSTGHVLSWLWSFGDGSTSTLQDPSHVYRDQGTYSVTLTVTGGGGSDTRTETDLVHVLPPPPVASFTGSPRIGLVPLTVDFTDLTAGVVDAWTWSFGDGGTSVRRSPTHTYDTWGTYTVSLTASGPGGPDTATATNYVTVLPPPPVAAFSASPTVAFGAPERVTFTDESTGVISGWTWDFGDGQTATKQNPFHNYKSGTFQVLLTVNGPGGSDSATTTVYIDPEPPTASFTATPTSGVTPLPVAFSDTSTGHVDRWAWSFGDGGTSSEANPLHTYTTAGVYTVTLQATGAGGSDTVTRSGLVTVGLGPPVSDFSATPTSGNTPLTVTFTNLTSGSASGWSWDFGDGATSSQRDPVHQYASSGAYTVSLSATGGGGSDTRTRVGYIVVSDVPPVASFTAAPTSGPAPLLVSFADTSSGGATLWSWDFGDGSGSGAEAPAHTYTTPGTYSVSLEVTGPGGTDSTTATGLVRVGEPVPVADFSASPTEGQAPLSVTFQDLSAGTASAWAWDFGDGTGSSSRNPVHVYEDGGSFQVALTVTGPSGSDTKVVPDLVTVVPPAPVAAFTAGPTSGVAPLSVSFQDRSTGTLGGWSWVFGDGGTSSAQNPTHVYSTPGTYSVSLTASGPGGEDTDVRADLIVVAEPPPLAAFQAAPTRGPAPLSVAFDDLSTGTVTDRAWNFGDGATSAAASPAHVYDTPGTYSVSLTVSGPGGSDTRTELDSITVLEPPPVAAFDPTPASGLAPLDVSFANTSTGEATGWAWTFGDGASSSLRDPLHTFLEPGTYTVRLVATGPGGSDSTTRDVVALPAAPSASFSASPTSGVAPLAVSFADLSLGEIATWSWSFGDGTSSGEASPAHVYAAPGTYTVSLTVEGPGGSDTSTQVAAIAVAEPPPQAEFSAAPASGQAPLEVAFTDLSTGSISGWLWEFGDGQTSAEASPLHTYGTPGTYTVALTVTGPGGSSKRNRPRLIEVAPGGPVAALSASPTSGPAPLEVAFADLSTGTVDVRLWDFGDGGASAEASPVHVYDFPGTYTVSLMVSGPDGADTFTALDLVTVDAPEPGLADGSFEAQLAGTQPARPWIPFGGGEPLIAPTDLATEAGMPTDGSQWCVLSTEGTYAALPPSNPGGETFPALGGTGVLQLFRYPAGATELSFDALFLRAGRWGDAAANDWMSVDLSDGTTTWNLYFRDTFSPTATTYLRNAYELEPVSSVRLDLLELFPASTPDTVFTLTAQVGNGGNGRGVSRGLLDRFRLEDPNADRPWSTYGCGVNPAGSLTVLSGEPRIGRTLTFGVDNPLGTQPAGSGTLLALSFAPDPAYPCGSLRADRGMDGPGAFGELLINVVDPDPFRTQVGPAWQGPGRPAPIPVAIPNNAALIGVSVYVQGQVIDPGASLGVGNAFTEAIELVVRP